MVPPAFVDIGQHFIVEHDCPPLVVGGGKELDHLPPILFDMIFSKLIASRCLLLIIQIQFSGLIKHSNGEVENINRFNFADTFCGIGPTIRIFTIRGIE